MLRIGAGRSLGESMAGQHGTYCFRFFSLLLSDSFICVCVHACVYACMCICVCVCMHVRARVCVENLFKGKECRKREAILKTKDKFPGMFVCLLFVTAVNVLLTQALYDRFSMPPFLWQIKRRTVPSLWETISSTCVLTMTGPFPSRGEMQGVPLNLPLARLLVHHSSI